MASSANKEAQAFSERLIQEALKQHFESSKTKISPNASKLTAQLLKLVTVEAAKRAAHQALKENETVITVSHFEKVLAQLYRQLVSAVMKQGTEGYHAGFVKQEEYTSITTSSSSENN